SDDAVPGKHPPVHGTHHSLAGVGVVAVERLEAGQQHGGRVGCADHQRNTIRYISTILHASSGSAVATCWRITALGSRSSSRAAGTRLKLAAIGVSSVPQ